MPETTYTIKYVVDDSKALRGLASIEAALKKTQAEIQKTAGMIKALGQNTPGLKQAEADLKRVAGNLGTVTSAANKAEAQLKDVGKGNNSLGSYENRVEKVTAALGAATAAGATATSTLAGVGQGGPGGGGRAGGTLGADGRRMATAAALGTAVAGRAAFREVARAGAEERGFLEEAAGTTGDFRESLREYASLRKEPGPNDKIVSEALALGKEGRLAPGEIAPYLTAYEGSATTGRDAGNIGGMVGVGGYTKAQQDALEARLKVRGAQFATRTGLDAKTAGDLTAVVSTYKKINSEADLAGQLGGMHYGVDQGRGEITPLARGELGQAGSEITSGRVSGLPELGAFIGVSSVASKTAGSAGTTYGQVSRLLNEVADDKGEFLKEAGVADKKGNFLKLKALRDHLAKVKPDDANSYLESKGFGNSTDRRSVLGMVGNVDVLEKRIAEANRIAANGQETMDRDAANGGEMATVNRGAKTAEFVSEVELGKRSEKLAQGQGFARARMKDPNQPGGQRLKAEGFTVVGDMWRYVSGAGMTGEEQRVNTEAVQGLIKGGKPVNVDVAKEFPDLYANTYGKVQDPQAFAADYNRAAARVESAGGDPFGGAPKDAATAARAAGAALNNLGNALDAVGNQRQGQAMPPPPGNGGAGFTPARR
jgi:hypothetical protein